MEDKNKVPKLSIIVPVYNVEKYIGKCVKSILSQTISDFELILVDDGSTDKSGQLCDEYADLDNRIIVLHKKNGGLSSARNAGIDIARGDYIGFVDGDDYIANDMYELLYENIIRENADMSLCGTYECFLNREPVKNDDFYMVGGPEEILQVILEGKYASANVWNKLYKRFLFQGIRYPVGRRAEDAFVIVNLCMKISRAVITTEQKYFYIHRECSITTDTFNTKDYDTIDAWIKNYDLIAKYYPKLEKYARKRLCWAYKYVLDKMYLSSEIDKQNEKRIIHFLRKNYWFIIISPKSWMSRTSITILLISKRLYRILLPIRRKRIQPLYA